MANSSVARNTTEKDFNITIRGKQFILKDDAELVIGVGDHQFMLSLDYDSKTVYLTDPRNYESIALRVSDLLVGGSSIVPQLQIVDQIRDLIDVSQVGLTLVDEDTRVTGVNAYNLNETSVYGTTEYKITDLKEGDLIYRVDLQILTPFSDGDTSQFNISIYGESGELLMPETWNDPNTEGTYSSSLNYLVGSEHKLTIQHNLTNKKIYDCGVI